MSYNDANEAVNELFESLRSRCQGNLETSMRGINFIFDSVQLMYYKCYKVNLKRGVSYIDSTDWKELNYPSKLDEGWHYIAVKKLSALLHGITSKHKGDFYCLNCLHSFRTKNKLKSNEKICKNKDFCGIVMPLENDNILEFNKYMKSNKMPYIIYADIESLIKKIDGCENNSENSSTRTKCEHIPCGYQMSTIWAFDHIENKHTLYHEKDCMKKSCESLRGHNKILIYFEKKKTLPSTKAELKSHQDAKVCYICGKRIYKKAL